VAEVYLRCDLTETATKDASYMTELGVIAALMTALCIGYHLGQRAGTDRPTWKTRTSRLMLSRLAVNLLLALTARRILRTVLGRRLIADKARVRRLRFQLPGNACRGGITQRQRDIPVRRRDLRRTRVGS
jgi:hypothetical protein